MKMSRVGLPIVYFIIATLFAILFSGASMAVLAVIVVTFIAAMIQCMQHKDGNVRVYAEKLSLTTLATYIISSLFFSSAFVNGQSFLMEDPLTYFGQMGLTKMDIESGEYLFASYFLFGNVDVLHMLLLRFLVVAANNYLGGASELYLTLTNAFFGVLSIGILFRILLRIVPKQRAYKYSLIFALCSQFHFYSVSYVRDIIIAFLFILAIDILLKEFKFKNIIALFIISLLIWGVRLFFGVFMLMVTAFYLYWGIKGKKGGRIISYLVIVAVLIVAVPAILRSELFELSTSEVSSYQEIYDESAAASGFSSKLNSLPHGLRELSLFFFSQMMPFPPFDAFIEASKVSHFYMAAVRCIFAVYWYFISFGLMYMLFLGKSFKRFSSYEKWLLIICAVFILLNSTQTDVRRLMCIYPLMLFFYVKAKHCYINNFRKLHINKNLGIVYGVLLAFYIALKM